MKTETAKQEIISTMVLTLYEQCDISCNYTGKLQSKNQYGRLSGLSGAAAGREGQGFQRD